MPLPITVTIISNNADIAGIATSVIRGNEMKGHRPSFVAAYSSLFASTPIFSIAGVERKVLILVATPYHLLNPKRIDLWLALDQESEEKALTNVARNGPAPQNFYRGIFPTAVANCGFTLPRIPSTKSEIDQWLNFLTDNLEPWKKRIWEAYSDSS
jgi:hypothetical protein